MNSQVEYKVAKTDDISSGEMKEFPIPGFSSGSGDSKKDELKILLAKVGKQYIASAPKCTHYGAQLVKGVISPTGQVTCPWHGACFNLCQNGDIEDAPAWDALPTFKTIVRDNDIYVCLPDINILKSGRRPPIFAKSNATADSHVVIVGGGASGYSTAECLRTYGFNGKITVISKENYYPIDRTKLSKALITDPSEIEIRGQADIAKLGIDFIKNTTVSSIDTYNKTISLSTGSTLNYTKLVLATGGSPKRLSLAGFDSENVYTLRTVDDTKKIVDSVSGGRKKVVVIGSSFIGLEIALPLAKEHDVTVVGMEAAPLERVLGVKVGNAIKKLHEKAGIKFRLSAEIKGATASSGRVQSVQLGGEESLQADVVVLGVGVYPETSYFDNPATKTSIQREKDGSIAVDGHMRVKGVENVYAVGDIAKFPYPQLSVTLRVEHWDVAMNQGRTAAQHIAKGDAAEPYNATLFFWSAQGSQLRYCGTTAPPVGFDDVMIQGSLDDATFAALYLKEDKVVAVASMGYDPAVALSSQLMARGVMPSRSDLESKDIRDFANV